MGAVTPGTGGGGQGFRIDPAQARQAAQELKRLGAQLMPSGTTAPEGVSHEKSVASVSAVTASGEHVAKECATFLDAAGAFLERAVQAFEGVDHQSASNINAVDPRNM